MRHGWLWMVVLVALPLHLSGCRLTVRGGSPPDAAPSADTGVGLDGARGDAAVTDAAAPDAAAPDAAPPDAGPDAAVELECFPAGPPVCDPGTMDGSGCFTDPTPCYGTVVQQALSWAYSSNPGWFQPGYEYQPGQTCDRILDPVDYVNQLSTYIFDNAGLCAAPSPWAMDCIAIKHDNAFDECYDVVADFNDQNGGTVSCRRTNVPGMYCDTCAPAYQ
jgi:hypothetical protein